MTGVPEPHHDKPQHERGALTIWLQTVDMLSSTQLRVPLPMHSFAEGRDTCRWLGCKLLPINGLTVRLLHLGMLISSASGGTLFCLAVYADGYPHGNRTGDWTCVVAHLAGGYRCLNGQSDWRHPSTATVTPSGIEAGGQILV